MATTFARTPPIWFYLVAIVIVLWAGMGCYMCYQQFLHGADAMPNATAYDHRLMASLPAWYNPVYAVAVGTGLLGGLSLLIRRAFARPLFVVSLIAAVVQFGYLFATTDIVAVKGAGVVLPFPIIIIAIAAGEIWLAGHAQERGWIH